MPQCVNVHFLVEHLPLTCFASFKGAFYSLSHRKLGPIKQRCQWAILRFEEQKGRGVPHEWLPHFRKKKKQNRTQKPYFNTSSTCKRWSILKDEFKFYLFLINWAFLFLYSTAFTAARYSWWLYSPKSSSTSNKVTDCFCYSKDILLCN